MNKADFAEHLRFFQELGVTGINADQAWRRRASSPMSSAVAVAPSVPVRRAALPRDS